MNRIVSFLFCSILLVLSVGVFGEDQLPDDVPCNAREYLSQVVMNQQTLVLYLERQHEELQAMSLSSQYQLGLLAFLSGVFSSFVFLYGLRLR